jgi:hypothetical protein
MMAFKRNKKFEVRNKCNHVMYQKNLGTLPSSAGETASFLSPIHARHISRVNTKDNTP